MARPRSTPSRTSSPDPVGVDHLERVVLQQALLQVGRHHPALDIVAAEAEGHLGQVVGPEGEEVGLLGDLAGAQGGPRRLDHGADEHLERAAPWPWPPWPTWTGEPGPGTEAAARASAMASSTQDRARAISSRDDGEGDHDLDDRVAARGHPVEGRLHEGPHLHGVEAGLDDAEAHPPGAEHGVELVPRLGRLEQPALLLGVEPDGGLLDGQLAGVGEELVQRRVEEPDGHRQRRPWPRGSRRSRPAGPPAAPRGRPPPRPGSRPGSSGARWAGGPRPGTCARSGTARCPRPRGAGRWRRRVRCRRWPAPRGGRPGSASAQPRMVSNSAGVWPRPPAPGRARPSPVVPSTEIQSPSSTTVSPTVNGRAGHPHGLGPDHRRLAPAPGHHGGVADQAAPGGEDALGGQHAVDVLGRGLAADQDDLLAPLGRGLGIVGGQVDPAHRRPGRGARAPWSAPS